MNVIQKHKLIECYSINQKFKCDSKTDNLNVIQKHLASRFKNRQSDIQYKHKNNFAKFYQNFCREGNQLHVRREGNQVQITDIE